MQEPEHLLKVQEKKKKPAIDSIIYVAAICMPFMTIPQIYNVWVLQQVTGVSIITWVMFTAFSCIWLWYAIHHKNIPLLVNNILWIIMQGSVAVGILVFG
ncbi:MAG: hypothetical protein ACMXYA_02960 [Candidatus Woesearchaeota archaeon]